MLQVGWGNPPANSRYPIMEKLMLKITICVLLACVNRINPSPRMMVHLFESPRGPCPGYECYHAVSVAVNLTYLTGSAGTESVTIDSPLGTTKSCPPLNPCRRGNKCCYRSRRPGGRCNYSDCIKMWWNVVKRTLLNRQRRVIREVVNLNGMIFNKDL